VGIIARVIKHAVDKFITLTGETRKDFNFNTLLYTPAGDDSVPLKDERLIIVKVDGTGKYVAVGVLTPSQGAKPGEKILFSRDDDGKVTSKLSFLNDGTAKLETEKDFIREIKGDSAEKVKGDKTADVKGKLTLTATGDISIEGDGKITNKAKGDIQLETLKKFAIKATQIEICGDAELILKTIGTSMWCPNGVTNCFICGAPHGGPQMGIVGLKGQ